MLLSKCFTQTTSSKEHAKMLLEITGSAKLGTQVMRNMISTFKKSMPSVPDIFWEDFLKEAKPEMLIDLLIPVYIKYYSDEELVKLIEFYKTPLGKKVTETLPLIAQDSYTIGAEWGKQISEQVVKKLLEKGYSQNN